MVDFSTLLDINFLKKSGATPNWFGLGFIQLKLTNDTRLHFYHPELSADIPEEELHDHRYDFHSHILSGQLNHEEWSYILDQNGDHEMIEVSCTPDKPSDPNPISKGFVKKMNTYHMGAGSSYHFSHESFHKVEAHNAITYLNRGPVVKDLAKVIKKIGEPSFCPFTNKIEESKLWEYIESMLPKYGYHILDIKKELTGTAAKIVEEAIEFADSNIQGSKVMEQVELSDLLGAIDEHLKISYPDINLNDLIKMKNITGRAFKNGRR